MVAYLCEMKVQNADTEGCWISN